MHSTFAEISLSALTHNFNVVKEKVRNSDILAVVKADAYGHGAARISRNLLKNGATRLGVAFTDEAIELRESRIKAPILVFFDSTDIIKACIRYNLSPVVFDLRTARKISDEARRRNKKIPVHIKIDTGMGRIGLDINNAVREVTRIASLENIIPEGLMSHFSEADLKEKKFAKLQLKKFLAIKNLLAEQKLFFRYLHIANSAAVLSMPDSHLDMVRPGIMLYGYGLSGADRLEPVLSLKSRVLQLKKVPPGTPISYGRTFVTERESTIATIPIGYADGYSRKLSNCGEVLINGKRAPVAGRVCMDTIMVDVTEIPHVKPDSEVVLIGSQGTDKITAEDLAEKTGTITYEVLSSIGKRVKRIYK